MIYAYHKPTTKKDAVNASKSGGPKKGIGHNEDMTSGEAQCVNKKSQTRLHQEVEQANTIMDDNSVEMDEQGEGVPDVFAPDSSKGRDPGKMPMEVSHTSA